MGYGVLFGIAFGLAMDAFAVSLSKGFATKTVHWKHMVLVGLWFGGFQGLMPLLGYFCGSAFQQYIEAYDHWIAFVLLAFLGGKMLLEAIKHGDEPANDSFAPSEMLPMAIATSIDALFAGVAYVTESKINIGVAVGMIAIVTFVCCAVGVKLGNIFGCKCRKTAEIAGGVILILMGLKILLEHLGVVSFGG